MFKKPSPASWKLFAAIALCILNSCSSSDKRGGSHLLPDDPFPNTSKLGGFCKKWTHATHANLSYLASSTHNAKLLVATSADTGRPRDMQARVKIIDSAGKTSWNKWLKQPVKSQSISRNGTFTAFSNYEDFVFFTDGTGKTLWKREHLGIPIFLNESKNLFVVNDEDSDPDTIFYLYSFKGELLYTGKTTLAEEPIDVAVSSDEAYAVAGLKKKSWSLFELKGKNTQRILSEKSIGEITAIGVQKISKDPFVFVLAKQNLSAFNVNARENAWTRDLDQRYEVLRVTNSGGKDLLFLYGNSSHGQAFEMIEASTGKTLWTSSFSLPANYSSPVHSYAKTNDADGFFTVLVDRTGSDSESIAPGMMHVVGFGETPNPLFSLPIEAPDGIYSYTVNPNTFEISVGAGKAGDSTIYTYRPCK